MILVEGLGKTFKVARRPAGLGEAVKALFRRTYTTVEALCDVSFTIEPGEIVGYIGPNGAGKSTTIKIMSGILVPDKGKCRILGYTPWEERVAYVRKIGVVFGQRSQLWWDVPVIDSFELLRDIYGVPAAEYRKNLALLVDTLELHGLGNPPVRQLSLGQRMRCELAASLLHGPEILFLDEPTIGLDALSKLAVRRFIRTINEEKGVTVILTTHDMNDIEALATRILLIGRGRILYDGQLRNLKDRLLRRKTVTVDFLENAASAVPVAIEGATLLSWTPPRASFSVDTDRTSVSAVISALSRRLELVDLSVEAPPIEELIAGLYREYSL
ncbi:MAG: ATP-binding cassette domain-containing protein [Firmicutes bacterium]|nr:ATP-binding cassette domain-containing protein [Bacillota bacterium]